ncbi:penicillin acylase family protein [Mitsuaria sp. GD03876]|uniref:penicillin acylase family protein n=1 Tax=Mitsuaria sp. GD03876 TaxID=2975399 RepID=UPI00244BA12F|nr:penicillin acylase family protein [Mitsuaria sp. GD03876]MDH0864414.1 penicillin acylase family protein [Mitsuaria sp. GD03876]
MTANSGWHEGRAASRRGRRAWALAGAAAVALLGAQGLAQARDTGKAGQAEAAGKAGKAGRAAKARVALAPGDVEIRRTTDGIPHLKAKDWRSLGAGIGYVQAQDALCTLAEAFVTYEGRRSWFFGPDERPARHATFGRSKNLDLDFFFRGFADEAVTKRYRAEQPAELNDLVDGFAAGYNRYLAEFRQDPKAQAGRPCAGADWLREISADDLYRRMYAAQVAAGLARFIPEIVNAKPAHLPAAAAPAASSASSASAVSTASPALAVASIGRPGRDLDGAEPLQSRLSHSIGEQPALGSNMLAFGREATGEDQALLIGNPHWFWGGPDRFYQMHLTVPGQLDVAGVSFLGVPVVMIGFNDQVAWSHTVSAARRFGLFQLTLDPADPTRILRDGQSERLEAREVRVELRGPDGKPAPVTRTLYRSRFGPVVDLGRHNAAFGWTGRTAIAIRDANEQNFGAFRNFFRWNRAASLDEFIAIQRGEAATPWVNTSAIGRGDGRVWFADIGPVPNVPDALRAACGTPLGAGFAQLDPTTPFLDGSRAACDWSEAPGATKPGLMPAEAMPALLRRDYVANMNDSYWLTNASAPLEGYPTVLGGERKALTLRGRLGHQMAGELLKADARSAGALSRRLKQAALTPRAYSAELFKDEVLRQACASPVVEWPVATAASGPAAASAGAAASAATAAGAGVPASAPAPAMQRVDIAQACEVLRRWDGRADANDHGALLWDAFWDRVDALPDAALYRVPFAADKPLVTPASPGAADGRVARALAEAVQALQAKGLPLDAAVARHREVASGGQQLPIYGGCHSAGYFVVACNSEGGERMGPNTSGNTYLQVVSFGAAGVEAFTLQAAGQDERALDAGIGLDPIRRYSRKDWLPFPFHERDIARDPALKRSVLSF